MPPAAAPEAARPWRGTAHTEPAGWSLNKESISDPAAVEARNINLRQGHSRHSLAQACPESQWPLARPGAGPEAAVEIVMAECSAILLWPF